MLSYKKIKQLIRSRYFYICVGLTIFFVLNFDKFNSNNNDYQNYPLNIDLWNQVIIEMKKNHKNSTHIQPITISSYKYLNNITINKCNINRHQKQLVIMLIKSNAPNIDKRNAIRTTWANESCRWHSNWIVKRMFLLALPNPSLSSTSSELQDKIVEETVQFEDIIQQNFVDHYYNNTWKFIMAIDWLTTYCHRARYAFFIDDDFLVYPNVLTNYLNQLDRNNSNNNKKKTTGTQLPFLYIGGQKQCNAIIFRDKWEKHYVSYEEISWNNWPPFLSAGAFIMNMELAIVLKIAMKYVKYFRFDDLYLALTLYKLGIEADDIGHLFSIGNDNDQLKLATQHQQHELIASHGFSASQLISRWKTLNLNHHFC